MPYIRKLKSGKPQIIKDVPLLLPNITRFDVASLYNPKLYNLIVDLRQKVQKTSSVRLITSNPDFVIINRERLNNLQRKI